MSTKGYQTGNVMDHIAGATIASGDVVVVQDNVGVAVTDIANAATGALEIDGVFTLPKVAGTAWVQGDSLDWDGANTGFELDKTTPVSGDVENCAIAFEAATSGATTGKVKLTPGTGTLTP